MLEQCLKPYPKLHRAIFPQGEEDGIPPQDITVYQLLKVGDKSMMIEANYYIYQSINI